MSAHAGALLQLGSCEIYTGSLPAAREYLERGIEVARSADDREMEAYCSEALGELGFVSRDPRVIAEDSYAQSQRIGTRIDAIQAVLALTPILRIDADEVALARVDELLTTADELIAATGARNLAPFVLLERAAVCASRGEVEQRVAHLRVAHAEFVLMGAAKLAAEIAPELG